MKRLLRKRIFLGFIVNPFYLYCVSFTLAVFVYLWGWSSIFPRLSTDLIVFLGVSSILFLYAGYIFNKKKFVIYNRCGINLRLTDIIFWLIIFLGIINVLYMRYLPVMDRTRNYREFGMPVIDPLFNTLSIFFSVFFFQLFLEHKSKRLLIYISIILVIQMLLFRRSAIIWIFTSSSFLYLLFKQKIRIITIIAGVLLIPLLSYCFGVYGNTRSSLSKSFVLNDLGASDKFKNTGISHNHYITYLYLSSPLANLQENINKGSGFLNKGDTKSFVLYCLLPVSVTIRLEKMLNITPPACYLITPELIVGTFFMTGFYLLGWLGMIIMLIFLAVFIILCLLIIKIWNTFSVTALSILSATVSLLIFSNFLNRLDVILMLFIYPVIFHFMFRKSTTFVEAQSQS
jgi:hypothetical protein